LAYTLIISQFRGHVRQLAKSPPHKIAELSSVEHLLELDDQVGRYLDSNPLTLQRQIQPDGETLVFAVQVTRPPPAEMSVIVGDVVHQLRSAVDHIADALVRAAGNTPTTRTVFPVFTTRPSKNRIDLAADCKIRLGIVRS
jgi:hypothetical protein